ILAGAGTLAGGKIVRAATPEHPLPFHVGLPAGPAKKKATLHHFKTIFRPAASKQAGYIDVQMLKLHSALQGKGPEASNYRFVLTFASEELRQKLVASAIHQKVWPTVENTLKSKNYTVLLYDTP